MTRWTDEGWGHRSPGASLSKPPVGVSQTSHRIRGEKLSGFTLFQDSSRVRPGPATRRCSSQNRTPRGRPIRSADEDRAWHRCTFVGGVRSMPAHAGKERFTTSRWEGTSSAREARITNARSPARGPPRHRTRIDGRALERLRRRDARRTGASPAASSPARATSRLADEDTSHVASLAMAVVPPRRAPSRHSR